MSPTMLIDPVTHEGTASEDNFYEDIDVDQFILDLVGKNPGSPVDLQQLQVDGSMTRTMEGASTLTTSFYDPECILLNSGLFARVIEVQFGGLWWRLVAVNKQDSQMELVFEDRDINLLRHHKEFKSATRNQMTRAEFCLYLIRLSKNSKIQVVCPELHKTQRIKNGKKEKKEVKDVRREAGLVDDGSLLVWYNAPNTKEFTYTEQPSGNVKHVKITSGPGFTVRPARNSQIDIGEQILDEGVKLKASDKVLIAAIATGMVETGLTNPSRDKSYNGKYEGVFQQDRNSGWTGLTDVPKAANEYIKRAISLNKQYHGISVGDLASRTQQGGRVVGEYSGKVQSASRYAKHWVENYGSAPVASVSYRKKFVFSTKDGGKKQDWWTAIKRLMDDVHWACFTSNGVLYMIAEEDLIRSRVRMNVTPHDDFVQSLNFNFDVGHTLASATIACRASKWVAAPGTVVALDGCGPANGRWLVQEVTRGLYDRNATITLKKSDHSLPEPASELVTRQGADEKLSSHAQDPSKRTGDDPAGRVGKVYIAPNANRPGVKIHEGVMDFLALMAGRTSERIQVNFGTNHLQYVHNSTNQSDHWTGDAADLDIGAPGDASPGSHGWNVGNNIAIAAFKVLGFSYAEAKRMIPGLTQFNGPENSGWNWRGCRVQVGWRTQVGGDHFNHVHIGVRGHYQKPKGTRQPVRSTGTLPKAVSQKRSGS